MYETIPENPQSEYSTAKRRSWGTRAVAILIGVAGIAGLAGLGRLDSATNIGRPTALADNPQGNNAESSPSIDPASVNIEEVAVIDADTSGMQTPYEAAQSQTDVTEETVSTSVIFVAGMALLVSFFGGVSAGGFTVRRLGIQKDHHRFEREDSLIAIDIDTDARVNVMERIDETRRLWKEAKILLRDQKERAERPKPV